MSKKQADIRIRGGNSRATTKYYVTLDILTCPSCRVQVDVETRVSNEVVKMKKTGDKRVFYYRFKCCKLKRKLNSWEVKEKQLEGN